MNNSSPTAQLNRNLPTSFALRIYTKFLCLITLFLIFAGAMVKSTESGLAVPDWPLSYGMVFPPMVGGVFYEHGHRMVASFVGFCTVILTIWILKADTPFWIKKLSWFALGAVILQGLLGGITVLFFLPTPISVCHGILAQLYFLILITIAYGLSADRSDRIYTPETYSRAFTITTISFSLLIFIQLIAGAVMRHTQSGLAIPDFPKMGGQWWPIFDNTMLTAVNDILFQNGLEFVTLKQMATHFSHRAIAVVIVFSGFFLHYQGNKFYSRRPGVMALIMGINLSILLQIGLGISTVLSLKHPQVTSLHVVNGAAILGISYLLLLKTSPLTISSLKNLICKGH